MGISGKTVVVTGGTRGIGLEIARSFAALGANLAIIHSGAASKSEEAVAACEALGVKCVAYTCDVSSFSETKSVCEQVVKEFGGVEALVNNAGITADNLILRMSEEEWDRVLAVNLKGAFNMIKHLTREFLRAKGGAIVNVSSVSGLMGNVGQANYAASKAGLIGLTKSVARELASRNITCNAVAPGYIETAMTAKLTDEMRESLKKNIPLMRAGQAEEVASAVVFLVENRYITGETLKVDGGMYI